MKLSIIIPYHDYPRYLIDCLTSVKEQGVDNFETVLVTNYQNDELLTIINDFSDAINIKHVLSEKTASVAVNRNLGLEYATGEYVYFLDSDDYLDKNTLKLLLERAVRTNADVVSGSRKITWYKKIVYEEIQTKQEATVTNNSLEKYVSPAAVLLGDAPNPAIKNLLVAEKNLGDVSVLNVLIKHSLLTEQTIRFDQDLTYYSDLPFITAVLNATRIYVFEENAIYVKRKHNDSINMPALSQIEDGNRFNEFAIAYQRSCDLVNSNSLIRAVLQRKMIEYYCDIFVKNIRRSPDESWRKEKYVLMTSLITNIEPNVLSSLTGYPKRLIKATITGNFKKVRRIILFYLLKFRFRSMIKNRNKNEINKTLYRHRFLKQRVEPSWVMFESFFGKSYSDSPKYIYEYLAKNYAGKYKFVWVLNDKKTQLPYDGITVRRFSLKYAYYLARAKYLVFNVRQPIWLKKRKEQVLLQTWHGTPLKRLVFDQEEVTAMSPTYKMQFYKKRQEWDYLIAANQFSSEIFRNCFMYDGKMLEVGYPRNDLLNHPKKATIASKIKAKLQIPNDKKLILYAPTWRDDEYIEAGKYKFQLQLNLDRMQQELGHEYVVLLRMHYYIASNLDLTGFDNFAFNVSSYNDITELYLISDVLITDYSSVFFDYAILKRPMLFFTYDLDKYRDMLRGFYISMEEELPGPLLFTSDEVIGAIKNIDQLEVDYQEKYDQFYQKFCAWEDGEASKRVVEAVFKD